MDCRAILTFFLLSAALPSQAQFWKKKEKQRVPVPTERPSALHPGSPAESERAYSPRTSGKARASKGPTYDLERQFYERVERVAKERRKAEKIMQKPQYSDPMYFGHKRPPKKRPPHKMKYCKECGIRH